MIAFQIKVWTANPQQFVEDEDDDTFSYTVRIAAQDLLLVRFCNVQIYSVLKNINQECGMYGSSDVEIRFTILDQ